MNKNFIESVLKEACYLLYTENKRLINERAHERTIVSDMLPYLRSKFTEYLVEVEYNREGPIKNRQTKEDALGNPIIPDIVVHKYGPNGRNLVAIEVKGYWNNESRKKDDEKLRGLNSKQGYEFIYRIELGKDEAQVIEVSPRK